MKGEYMSNWYDNELPMCEGNYILERDYEDCPNCLGTGVKQSGNYNEKCNYCNGSQGSAYWNMLIHPGSTEWNQWHNRNDKPLPFNPEALDNRFKYKLRKE
jgi:hypothetical protein